jgi:hypothetical protein
LINWNDPFFDLLRGKMRNQNKTNLTNINLSGSRDYLGLFAAEFYIAQQLGGKRHDRYIQRGSA